MTIQRLSIIVPAFNEGVTVYEVLAALSQTKLIKKIEKEIIVVNDCSNDNTEDGINRFIEEFPSVAVKYIKHQSNRGKGAAIHTAIQVVTGDYIIIQDADLELNPDEINLLLEQVINYDADVVYGSRFMNQKNISRGSSYYANKFLTGLSNLCSGLKLTDMETCYKLIRTTLIKKIQLKEMRFGYEPEITAKLAKVKNIRISEVPVSYKMRSTQEGKKIGWMDGLRAIYCIVKYNLL